MEIIHFPATDEKLAELNDFIHRFLPDNCPPETINQIDLAVEEIFVNIAHYAYEVENDTNGAVSVTCHFERGELCVTFADKGKPFNPLAKEDPDITLAAEDRKIGGLGIFLTKKFMDCVDYEYVDGENRLTLRKTIQ